MQQAADRLDRHQSRIRQLVVSGRLAGRRVGSLWLVDDRSVARRLEMADAARGRPLSTRIAWSAAALLDGQPTPWLATSERSRLRTRLNRPDVTDTRIYRWWMQSRGRATRFRMADSDLAELCATPDLAVGGVRAASGYGVSLGYGDEAEVYVDASTAQRLVDEFFLIESALGNLTMRVVDAPDPWHLRTARARDGALVVPRLIAAVDLLDSDDTRSRNAGAQLLKATLSSVDEDLRGV